jgi:3-oxoacyl-[acyl-carrier-protein] synthase II
MGMEKNRVVVTGLGAVTPIGTGASDFWKALIAGENGVSQVSYFDTSAYRSQLAAEVKSFDAEKWIDPRETRYMDRFSQYGVVSSILAWEDAGLNASSFDPLRAGVIIGSGIGGSKTIEDGHTKLGQRGPRGLHPFFVPKLLINTAACLVSIRLGLKGPLSAPSVACSSGANAIGDACRIIERGDADIMLAGGSEACITPLAYGGFCATRAMSANPDPGKACRPFDRERDGFVMGEGAGIAFLENREHAISRKANIYAEVVGYGNTADAHHLTAPGPGGEGMARVMQVALHDAHLKPEKVGYVNAHGTSTPLNDKNESAAIMKVFGSHAYKLKVSSTKSMIGHLMAASGAVEFVATALSVHHGMVPPTIHYENPDPECPLDYVPGGPEAADLRYAITNSFGFGGGNVSLVLKKHSN